MLNLILNRYQIFILLVLPLQIFAQTVFELHQQISDVESQKILLSNQISESKRKININQIAINEKKNQLAQFIKSDIQLKQFQYGGLLAIENIDKLKRNLKIFEKIKTHHINLLRELKYFTEDLEKEKHQLIKKSVFIEQLSKDLTQKEQLLLEAEKVTVKALIVQKKDSLLLLKGNLSLPVIHSQLKDEFGAFNESKNQFILNKKGISFQTDVGQIVQSIGPGKIIFRDHIKYWGESVIIEHPGDYYSMYTHLKNIRFEENYYIQGSEQIGETAGTEFYFELRNKTIAINPKNWIRN